MAPPPSIGMLRPGLELAWVVAKAGTQARPAVPPPGRLRPLMRFAKLPDRALTTVRQVVEEDDDFRGRVAEWAQEAELDRAPWLWLVRPDGWQDELGSLVEAAGAVASQVEEEKEERSARRRLGAAELAAARAEAELARLRRRNHELTGEVAAERQARRRAEAGRDAVEAATRQAADERTHLEREVATLEATVAGLTADLHAAARELMASHEERHASQVEAGRMREQVRVSGDEVEALRAGRDQTRRAVSRAVSRAAAAAQELSIALGEAALSVGGGDVEGPSEPVRSDFQAAPPLPAGRGTAGRQARARRPGRLPVPLPPAVFDDSFEAADHLVRTAGILLIVDGYNVTISSWPHLELPRQRHRLVDALAELAMRNGTAVHVVFDGAETGGRFGAPAAARRRLRVTFSPDGVDADEVIVDLVEHLDLTQPVVVATDDRAVRDEVRLRGANVISVAQLLAVLGRTAGSAAG